MLEQQDAVTGLAHPATVREMAALAGAPARQVSHAEVLRDGERAFPAMIDLIANAQRIVRFENFIFAGDATGRRFADALSAAAKRGVDVRVLYDPVGTLLVRGGSIATVLRENGVDARPFRPLSPFRPWSWPRLKHRDHRKLLAVDGDAAVVGGFCISDNWSPSAQGGRGWRDTGLLVRGPVVADLERAFAAMWRRADDSRAPPEPPAESYAGVPAALVAADQPGERHVSALYQWLAGRARQSLEITDAYLVTPPRILAAFAAAARRGVAVRLLLPGRNNHPVAGAAARHVYAPLLAAGVEIWEWDGLMVHAKTAVVDGEVTLVGSSNLDPLSIRRNYELNLLVADRVTGRAMQEMFARDLATATRIDPARWARRPGWQRALEAAASWFSPNL
jgi:cardiolipin synthase A/B